MSIWKWVLLITWTVWTHLNIFCSKNVYSDNIDNFRMFRLVGFLGGTILFFVLAIERIPGFVYYYICAVFCLTIILLLIIFRIAAKYLDGFWQVWCSRLQRWISSAVMCLSRYTDLPEYSVNSPPVVPPSRPIWWHILEFFVCFIMAGFAPLLMVFVIFCYGEAIYRQNQYQNQRRYYKEKREVEVERQSARMSLELPLNKEPERRASRAVNYIEAVPVVIELEPVRMSQERKKTITQTAEQTFSKPSLKEDEEKHGKDGLHEQRNPSEFSSQEDQQKNEQKVEEKQNEDKHIEEYKVEQKTQNRYHQGEPHPQHQLQMDFNERIVNNPQRSIPLNLTRVTQQSRDSRSYMQSGDYSNFHEHSQLRESLPRYSPGTSPPRSPMRRIGNDKL